MNPRPEKALFEEAAALKGMAVSFVEKDWFVTQVIAALAALEVGGFEIIFSGGTALSKGHGLLQRFSEDVDFRVRAPQTVNRKALSNFKHAVVAALRQHGFALSDEQIKAGDGNRFVAMELDYESVFTQPAALRPHLQIELTVSDIVLPPVVCSVRSFLNELAQRPPEVTAIGCLDPVESAADKLSAVTWRIPDRIRGQAGDDPTVVRHLHDLAILKDRALAHAQFPILVTSLVTKDDGRAKNSPTLAGLPVAEKFRQMLEVLESDLQYEKEYDRFVKGVSYAKEGEIPDFVQTLQAVRELVEIVLAQAPKS